MPQAIELEPVVEQVACGGDAVDLLCALNDFRPTLLDSGGGGVPGTHTILGLLPRRILRWSVGDPGDPLELIQKSLQRYRLVRSERWPFLGGLLGYFGYGLRTALERLPDRHPVLNLPDLIFGDHRLCVLRAEGSGETAVCTLLDPQDAEGNLFLRNAASEVVRRLAAMEQPSSRAETQEPQQVRLPPRKVWCEKVERILDHIARGDIYQANLSQRFEAPRPGRMLEFYRRLRRINPAQFGGFVSLGGEVLLCLSPERFLRVDGRRVWTRPIKGTAARSQDQAQDQELARALQQSGKDRAELAMIVDVLRNDLARVCVPGSVQVKRALELQTLPLVHHLVADVEGVLEEGLGPLDLVRAAFPGGSITGAPRIRAMQIIDELESCQRGPYTGSLGYIGFDGRMDLNIMIRTAWTCGPSLHFHGGGGIVADSRPDAEYEETVHKVRGFLMALEEREL